MIDIHCHILPGVDDGSESLEESLAMARQAVQDGIRHIVVTPHFNDKFRVERSEVLAATAALQNELDRVGIGIRLHPGSEVRLEDANRFEEDLRQGAFCFLNDNGRHLLLEQRWHSYHPQTPEVVRRLITRGIIPIVPHPERHFFFREEAGLLEELLAAGAWTQVSVDSLLGANGPEARDFARLLLDRNQAHTLATDAHNVTRKPNLSEGFRIVREGWGNARAEEIRLRLEGILGAE